MWQRTQAYALHVCMYVRVSTPLVCVCVWCISTLYAAEKINNTNAKLLQHTHTHTHVYTIKVYAAAYIYLRIRWKTLQRLKVCNTYFMPHPVVTVWCVKCFTLRSPLVCRQVCGHISFTKYVVVLLLLLSVCLCNFSLRKKKALNLLQM